jgi:hypothetical protein
MRLLLELPGQISQSLGLAQDCIDALIRVFDLNKKQQVIVPRLKP